MTMRRKQASGSLRLVAVVAVALTALVAGSFGLMSAKEKDTATVYAEFTDASPLIVGNDVKTSGVKVGRVASIEVVDGHARVGLHLDRAALPLHEDAAVNIRPVSLLGERYVELRRGTPSKPAMATGATIPVQRTGRSVDLHEVLDAVDQPTGKALAALMTTLGEGAHGRGKDADAAIRALAPALSDTQSLLEVLDRQSDLLTQLIDQVQPVASAMSADEGRTLDGLVDATDQVMGVAQANQEELAGTLRELPATLVSARRALSELAGVAHETTPTLRALRPTTDDLTDISEELLLFAEAADPALASLPPVLTKAEKLLDKVAPLAVDLRELGPDLEGTARGARPVAEALLHRDLRTVMDFIRNWALTTNGRDGLSHYFRAHVVASPETVTGPIPGGPAGPLAPLTGPNSALDGLLPDLPLLTPKSSGGDSGGGGLLGLNQSQEKSMLSFLIGGSR